MKYHPMDGKMKEKPAKRKRVRLKNFDYSSDNAYFITICTQNRSCAFSRVVGRGLAPAVTYDVEYTVYGEIAKEQLMLLERRYPTLKVDKYIIMPNHIHVILILNNAAGASPRPTIMDIICAYKSLTGIECKRNGYDGKLFQTSFYDHIIRCQEDYDEIAKYIHDNPARWHEDKLYAEE